MSMFKLAAFAAMCAGTVTPAWAAEYFTSYSSASGTATTASFWLTTADTLNAIGGYDVLSMRGDVNGDMVTGLESSANQPFLSLSANGKFNFNNVLYGTGPIVDNDGVVFNTLSGANYNIYSNSAATADYTLSGYVEDPSLPGSWVRGSLSTGSLSALAAPPPASPRVLPTGPTVLTFDDARGYEPGLISTPGFDFTSAPCCAHSFGIYSYAGAGNGTQRITYENAPITMTVFDGSAFNVTSLDAGIAIADSTTTRIMSLIGTRRDGSTITTDLTVGGAFHSYALEGFDDLISLTFGHPGGGEIMTFDNIAVSLSPGVPEPASWALMFVGFGAVGASMRSARTRRAAHA